MTIHTCTGQTDRLDLFSFCLFVCLLVGFFVFLVACLSVYFFLCFCFVCLCFVCLFVVVVVVLGGGGKCFLNVTGFSFYVTNMQ